ncbi:type IX secretion system sortase PorU [Gilvibacter sp.]|uniref:type IX secretion system sortase PorU n=1 Tax=Gilvibacter sp. TaxID=2729997 RepID=UPI0025BD1B89|nr:type IX secretion system sortase PorU [Gilvibacter sp.]NQX76740.1 type IX secretion system sortase PorU [Gilvibacter sp.]
MTKKIAFLFLLLPFLGIAQQNAVVLPWQSQNQFSPEATEIPLRNVDQLAGAQGYVYYKQWEDGQIVNPNSLQISNLRFIPLTAAEQEGLVADLVPNTVSATIETARARDKQYSVIGITPIVKRSGRYEKLISFTADYSYQATAGVKSTSLPITNSVLATGTWYKFQIDQTGVYRISRSFLASLGMNLDGIDPNTIKIYGHGGKPLPRRNNQNDAFDLPEVAIQVVGGDDGSFDSGDEILFYGVGTRGYIEDLDTNINPYSDEAYYYVTAGGTPGRRIATLTEPDGAPTVVITQFDDYQFFEEDDFSIVNVGRRWFGNPFEIESEQTFEFTFPNIVGGTDMAMTVKTAAASESVTTMDVSVNGSPQDVLSFVAIGEVALASGDNYIGVVPASGEEVTVTLTYNNAGNPASFAFLDYIGITARRQLTGVDGQFPFQYNDAAGMTGIGQYSLSNANDYTQIWDVTDPRNPLAKATQGEATVDLKANLGQLRQYVAVTPSDYFSPIRAAETFVANQNLKGTLMRDANGDFQDIDYLIVAPPFMMQPALRLAAHRADRDGLRVKVVSTDRIYEEFSSGAQDIGAIRNLVKYVYDNASSSANRIKYLCLFGDASVDYKDRLSNNNNIVPTYHTFNSFNTLAGYMSDDFYGMMDPTEGRMESTNLLDIAVGRIVADDVALANTMVDKLIRYDNKPAFGNWRNNFVLVSDDVDEAFEYNTLEVSLDNLGDDIASNKPFINVKKIHTDAFLQETSAGGNRYPDVNEAIVNSIDVGTLVLTYLGHGGEDGLAKEFIFTKDDAEGLQNTNRYPLIVTVTCEFSRFDNPLRPTAGEFTYWNENGGAVALITTTRTISVGLGVDFNNILAPLLFAFGSDNFDAPSESLRKAKNLIISDERRRVVFYVGDPAMQLAFPKQQIRLNTVNGIPITTATDTLKALSRVKLGGEVLSPTGAPLPDYNGVAQIKVFDKNVQRQTLGNDGVTATDGTLLILDYQTLGSGLFNGQATVTNGQFEIEFVVPRDIAQPVGNGRVSFYAEKDNAFEDQTGFNEDIRVGGLDENAPDDNLGPEIQLFMNDESFVNGGITNDSPILIAKLMDEHGINTASGIGHDMLAILDGDEANPIILNDYYLAGVDDFTEGTANYRLRNLEEGPHTLTLKAWDTYNNSSTADIQFVVAGDDELRLERVLNYPNPFVNYTEFWFNHNRPFEPLEVQVQVFTVSGKVVWTKNQVVTTDGFLSRDIVWDGRDDFGDRIGKGVYVYKLTVKSTLTNQQVEKFEKLVVL